MTVVVGFLAVPMLAEKSIVPPHAEDASTSRRKVLPVIPVKAPGMPPTQQEERTRLVQAKTVSDNAAVATPSDSKDQAATTEPPSITQRMDTPTHAESTTSIAIPHADDCEHATHTLEALAAAAEGENDRAGPVAERMEPLRAKTVADNAAVEQSSDSKDPAATTEPSPIIQQMEPAMHVESRSFRTPAISSDESSTSITSIAIPHADSCEQATHTLEALAAAAESEIDGAGPANEALFWIYPPKKHGWHIEAGLQEILSFRAKMVTQIATENAKQGIYSFEEWASWFETHCFSRNDMNVALPEWHSHFENTAMHTDKAENIFALRATPSRQSKADARKNPKSAHRAWLKEICGHATLAKTFLKFPSLSTNDILNHWGAYTQTPEYIASRARAACDSEPQQKEKERELKIRCYRLRNKRRWARHLLNTKRPNELSAADQRLITYFQSGSLDVDLEKATREHGFGRIHHKDRAVHLQTITELNDKPCLIIPYVYRTFLPKCLSTRNVLSLWLFFFD